MRIALYFISCVFLLVHAGSLSIDAQPVRFRHLTIDEGLSQNAVFSIIKDRKGFMWFGTKDGLNRYDGYSFVVYNHNPFEPTTISSNYITTLFEDSRGLIWVGTLDGGLSVFDPGKEIFYRVPLVLKDSLSRSNYKIETIVEGPESEIWAGTSGGGLFCIQPGHEEQMTFIQDNYLHNPGNEASIGSNVINDLLFDEDGGLWIGTRSGLNKLDLNSGIFTRFEIRTKHPKAEESPFQSSIGSVYFSKDGTLWLGTLSGLVKFDRQNGSYKVFPHRYEVSGYGRGNIVQIKEDRQGYLWLATAAGLMRFNPATDVYEYFQNDPLNTQSISFNSISSLYIDDNQMIWAGTPGMGINIYDPKANRFPALEIKNDPSSRISGFSVKSVTEDNEGHIWVSGDVLYQWDRASGKVVSFEKTLDEPDAFGNTGIWSMIKSHDGTLWAVTTQGLYRYQVSTGQAKQYKFDPANRLGLPQNEVYTVFEDKDKQIWVATKNFLCRMTDIEKGYFQCMLYSSDSNYNEHVRPVIYQDIRKVIWMGTKDGLIRLNEDSVSFTVFKNDPAIKTSLSDNHIKSICADPSEPANYLWIGTTGGLNRFDMRNAKVVSYTDADGLPNNVVYGILPDDEGNLWLSTNRGLSCFDPVTGVFRNYNVKDGLQSNEFNTGASFRSESGELFFGGIKGLNYFYPSEIKDNLKEPAIVLTNLKIGDKSISYKSNPKVLQKSITETSHILIPHNHISISFEYAALEFTAPEKNQYAYKLEHFDHDWIYAGTSRTASYTHLPPGEYVFRVKASNNDGIWNETGLAVALIITPPWWDTWWAFLIFAFLVMAGLYLLRRYELNRVRLRNQLKLEKIETDSLRHIDQMKSQFFANISHEFRTPLTLILGQLESVITSVIDPEEKMKLQVADRNARRLLTLINQLLDLSKLEAGSMKLHRAQHDIASFLKVIFFSFQSLAEMKGITLTFESDKDRIPFMFDADKIEKVFYNLVSNALKFTDDNGKVKVKIHAEANDIEIRVENSGEGIPADQLAFVFDRFYQVDSSATRNYEGTGIGLALARELVELHHGTITVESDHEITAFIVSLPVDNMQQEAVGDAMKISKEDFSSEYYIVTGEVGFEGTSVETMALPAETGEIILIVEDNKEVREFIRMQLAGDYQVKEAENGLDGLVIARDTLPDLIISDVMMPKMDGYQFCKKIREDERTSHIPIIMLTAKAGDDDRIEGLETGVDDYITKPFSTKELKVRVRNLVNQRRLLRARFRRATVIHPDEVTAINIDQAFLDKIIKAIGANYENTGFSVDSLAREVNMSVSQLNRKLNALIDQPAGQLMRSLRLQRAAELLEKNAGSVAQVCYQLGFNDQAYFSRAFKKQFGCSPSEYMKG